MSFNANLMRFFSYTTFFNGTVFCRMSDINELIRKKV